MSMDEIPFGEPEAPAQDESVQEESTEGLASPFLSKIPPADRAIVARYIKDWDAGVTKRFQEYSGKLKPYEAFGPVEEIQRWQNLSNNFRMNPEGVFRIMYEGLQEQYGEEFEQHLVRILGLEEEEMSDEQEYVQEPDPDETFQQNVMSELEELRAWREEQVQAQASKEEEAQLDGVLSALHKRYGDFDDEGVLVRIAAHGDPHKAVQEWRAMVAKYSQNGAQRQAPKVMGGQGGVPSEQVDATKLRGQQRRAAVQNALAGLQDQS